MTRSLIVDGTKEVIANGRSVTMHAISKPTDYTHQRIVGYAVTLEDAHLFAAAEEFEQGARAFVEYEKAMVGKNDVAAMAHYNTAKTLLRAALSKSEVR